MDALNSIFGAVENIAYYSRPFSVFFGFAIFIYVVVWGDKKPQQIAEEDQQQQPMSRRAKKRAAARED